MKSLLAIAILTLSATIAVGQASTMSADEWVEKLSDPADKNNSYYQLLFDSVLMRSDSSKMVGLLQELQQKGNQKSIYFKTRVNLFRGAVLYYKDYLRSDRLSRTAAMQLMKQAMQEANESNDEYLLALVSRVYYSMASFYNETELAVMYGIYSIELYEKLFGERAFPVYNFVAELMFRVKEYERCKNYCVKWLAKEAGSSIREVKEFRISVYNTMALAYYRTSVYDSAMYFYTEGLREAEQVNRIDWKGIISGNIGQVYYQQQHYETAIALLDTDYRISMDHQLYDNALNALQWSARAYAAKGNGVKAMQQFRASMALLHLVPEQPYRRNVYAAAVEVFKVNGLFDSAMYYSGLYQKVHDSIEKGIATSSLAISNVRLNEEKGIYNIRRLQLEKKEQKQQRNFIILGILLMAFISVVVVNRQRVKLKYQQESLEKEKQLKETELAAARRQMEMFTQNIIEKTSLIEKLEQQMKETNASAGQQETIAVLSNLTILTEQDWDKFKELFEKMYPMFFQRLKATAPDITVAEQRMTALTRLQLTTRQMATMQGISPDSVHKTRQRLRQRLGLTNDTNLEKFFGSL